MDKDIVSKAEQLLSIEPIAEMYSSLICPGRLERANSVETSNNILTLVNIIVKLVEGDSVISELAERYDALPDQIYIDQVDTFTAEIMQIATEVFTRAIELHKNNSLILWQPGKGAVLVNGN